MQRAFDMDVEFGFGDQTHCALHVFYYLTDPVFSGTM
jgi:hypothetical protein